MNPEHIRYYHPVWAGFAVLLLLGCGSDNARSPASRGRNGKSNICGQSFISH